MKIEAFATLDAVLRGGSFAAAAIEMNLTPSAVSMQMKQLEQYLGQPLFDRSGLQSRPLPAATEVAATMGDSLRRIEGLRQRSSIAVEGTVQLGMIESLMVGLLPDTLSYLRRLHPGVRVRPQRGRSTSLTAAVKAGQLDAAVVARPASGGGVSLHWHPLARRELVLIAPPDATEPNAAALLRRHDWIRYDRHSVTGEIAARHVQTLVPEKRSAMEFDSASTIIAMVNRGLGVSIIHLLNADICRIYPVREVALGRGAPALELCLVMRKPDIEKRALAVIRDALTAAMNARLRIA